VKIARAMALKQFYEVLLDLRAFWGLFMEEFVGKENQYCFTCHKKREEKRDFGWETRILSQ
jgi:hypothetical protein